MVEPVGNSAFDCPQTSINNRTGDKMKYTILASEDGRKTEEVEGAEISRFFAIRCTETGWKVDHLPTGCCLPGKFEEYSDAVDYAKVVEAKLGSEVLSYKSQHSVSGFTKGKSPTLYNVLKSLDKEIKKISHGKARRLITLISDS